MSAAVSSSSSPPLPFAGVTAPPGWSPREGGFVYALIQPTQSGAQVALIVAQCVLTKDWGESTGGVWHRFTVKKVTPQGETIGVADEGQRVNEEDVASPTDAGKQALSRKLGGSIEAGASASSVPAGASAHLECDLGRTQRLAAMHAEVDALTKAIAAATADGASHGLVADLHARRTQAQTAIHLLAPPLAPAATNQSGQDAHSKPSIWAKSKPLLDHGARYSAAALQAHDPPLLQGERNIRNNPALSPLSPHPTAACSASAKITSAQALAAAKNNDSAVLQRYVSQGGDVNLSDAGGHSLLLLVMSGVGFEDELAMYLLRAGASSRGTIDIDGAIHGNHFSGYNGPIYRNVSALQCAYLAGDASCGTLSYLLEQPDTNFTHTCEQGNTEESLQYAMTAYPDPGSGRHYTRGYGLRGANLLHLAAMKNDSYTARRLVDTHHFDVNAPAELVENPHLCSRDLLNDRHTVPNHSEPGWLADYWVCRTSVSVYAMAGITALHLAARSGSVSVVSLLLQAGANPDVQDSRGHTPLRYANETYADISLNDFEESDWCEYYTTIKEEDLANSIDLLEKATGKNSKRWKQRLFIGEGNFSGITAILKKHALMGNLGRHFIATELSTHAQLLTSHGPEMERTFQFLQAQGVTLKFDVDARNMSATGVIPAAHGTVTIPRIHFNFPHDKRSFRARTLPKLLQDFFKAASQLQRDDDRIHMALPCPSDVRTRKFYQAYVYKIFEASAQAGYVLLIKRAFDKTRYPGYQHAITNSGSSASVAEEAREYIFAKTSLTYQQICKHQYYGSTGTYYAYGEISYVLPELRTDPGSTDYEERSAESAGTPRIRAGAGPAAAVAAAGEVAAVTGARVASEALSEASSVKKQRTK